MIDIHSKTSSSSTIWKWKSPIPYLFVGLALVLVIIVLALAILVWTGQKGLSDEREEPTPIGSEGVEFHSDPLVVVIMAGDDCPKFMAKPSLE